MKGLFDMANNNTLLALAYIRESENPLKVFCNLILYCLNKSENQELRHDELKREMINNFGLTIPNYVINSCASYLKNNNLVQKLPSGAGYKLISNKFDSEKFEFEKNTLADNEKTLINELRDYVYKNYAITWSEEEAHHYFSDLILKENTMENVIDGLYDGKDNKQPKYIQPTWYVKKYVMNIMQKAQGSCYKYFIDVFNGALVLNGLMQTNDYSQNKHQKFKGTEFYFDTKILLRLLGFTFPYIHETAKELVDLIKNEYDGKILVFEHVIREMKSVISFAEDDMKNKGHIDNFEFEYFRKIQNYSANDFKIEKDSIKERLINEYDFSIIDDIDWTSKNTTNNNADTERLIEYIEKENPTWKYNTIKNDVYSILQTNIRRGSNYSTYFGGKLKLPIFVTTNAKLVFDIKKYSEQNVENDSYICPWTNVFLPLITDRNLTCRLWLTSKRKDAISLDLAKAAFLFQQSDSAFYEKIKKTYKDVKEKHKYNIVDLDYERFEKLKENIIFKTKGDLEIIDHNVVATSFEELAQRQSEEKDSTISSLINDNNTIKNSLSEMELNFIESCAKRYANNVSILKKILKIAIKQLPAILGVIGLLIAWLLDYCITNEILNLGKLYGIIPVLIAIIFVVLDKNIPQSLIKKLSNKYEENCKITYKSNLRNQLPLSEKPFEEEILKETIKLTKFFEQKD